MTKKTHSHGEPPLAADQRIARCLVRSCMADSPERAVTADYVADLTGLPVAEVVRQLRDFATSTFAVVPVAWHLPFRSCSRFYIESDPDRIRAAAKQARAFARQLLEQAATIDGTARIIEVVGTARIVESAAGERCSVRGKKKTHQRRTPRRVARAARVSSPRKKVSNHYEGGRLKGEVG